MVRDVLGSTVRCCASAGQGDGGSIVPACVSFTWGRPGIWSVSRSVRSVQSVGPVSESSETVQSVNSVFVAKSESHDHVTLSRVHVPRTPKPQDFTVSEGSVRSGPLRTKRDQMESGV